MPEPASHTGRSLAIVAGAVIIIIFGALVAYFYLHPVAPANAPQAGTDNSNVVLTADQKEQLLGGSSNAGAAPVAAPPDAEASEHEHILQGASEQNSSDSSLSQDDKMKLLQH